MRYAQAIAHCGQSLVASPQMKLEDIVEKAILEAIIEAQYHASNAAIRLDIARNTLSNKCKGYGVLRTSGTGINPPLFGVNSTNFPRINPERSTYPKSQMLPSLKIFAPVTDISCYHARPLRSKPTYA